MRFKNYTWPHNPKIYEIEFRRHITSHKIPFGYYVLQSLGRTHRVLRGEGEFSGNGAYEEFRRLGSVFYENTPGVLVHPLWQSTNAFFVSLNLRQEPREDYVSYSFEFWECFDGYKPDAKIIQQSETAPESRETYYTVVYGDTLWGIAQRFGMTLNQLLALNPQIKNPNLIYPGDQIRIS